MTSARTGKIKLRPATPDDFAMALDLYLVAMKPLTAELMTWDEAKQSKSFAEQWRLEDVQVIVVEGRSVGWMQSTETSSQIFLQQLFVAPTHQRQGIGSEVLQDFLSHWRPTGKPVVLTVLKNNPARHLYERFGFAVVGEVGVKFQMRRDSGAKESKIKHTLVPDT